MDEARKKLNEWWSKYPTPRTLRVYGTKTTGQMDIIVVYGTKAQVDKVKGLFRVDIWRDVYQERKAEDREDRYGCIINRLLLTNWDWRKNCPKLEDFFKKHDVPWLYQHPDYKGPMKNSVAEFMPAGLW